MFYRREKHHITLEDYKSLFDKLYARLCLFANRYVNNMDLSKDIVQEVFIKTWEKQPAQPHYNAIKSFLYTSVKNKCLNYLKSKHYRVTGNLSSVNLELLESKESFLTEVVNVETHANLERAIEKLPDKCKRVIQLSLNNYSNKDIAEELSITTSTVRTQKQTAYEKLRNILLIK